MQTIRFAHSFFLQAKLNASMNDTKILQQTLESSQHSFESVQRELKTQSDENSRLINLLKEAHQQNQMLQDAARIEEIKSQDIGNRLHMARFSQAHH